MDIPLLSAQFETNVPGIFIAGADVSEFSKATSPEQAKEYVRLGQLTFQKLSRLPQVTVAAIDGASGETLWTYRYDEGARGDVAPRSVSRGVSYWTDGKGDERILYFTTGYRLVELDAKTGTLLWRYRRPLPTPVILLHPTSRGVAVYNNKVYFAAGEGVLVALDAVLGGALLAALWATGGLPVVPPVPELALVLGAAGALLGLAALLTAA